MAEFKFNSVQITKIDDTNNLFQIIFDNHSQSYLLDFTSHVNKNDLVIYDNVINKQYVFNYTAVKVRANEIQQYQTLNSSKELFLYLFELGFFDKRCCKDTTVEQATGIRSYVANLTQSGTNAPIITELLNTTGRTITASYVDVGTYSLIASSPFDVTNASKIETLINNSDAIESHRVSAQTSLSHIKVLSATFDGTAMNGILKDTTIRLNFYE